MKAFVRRWVFPVWCIGCGAPDVAICPACAPGPADGLIGIVENTGLAAAGAYDGIWRQAIVAMKHGERAYLDPMAEVIAAMLRSNVVLIPLPTSRRRRAARGFDQAVELARRAAALHGIGYCDVLEKRGAAQRGLNRLARLQAGDRFRLKRAALLPRAAIVIDDVCTTGATMSDGIATLRAAGVEVHGALVLARAAARRNPPVSAAVLAHGVTPSPP